MKGNVIVGQSGGPTAVINSSLAGVYCAAKKLGASKVYGMRYGIKGFIGENYIDLSDHIKTDLDIELLKRTPASFLGTSRYKLPEIEGNHGVYEKIFDILNRLGIGVFIYIGGNDSMDTIKKLSDYAALIGHPTRFIGCPKTIDNDLPLTDHTPGYGSAAKYIGTAVKEIIRDSLCMENARGIVTVLEIMGRNAGWLTGACALAKGPDCSGPDLIYLPELSFDVESFLDKVKELLKTKQSVVVAVSEGIRLADGRYVCELGQAVDYVDAFGHRQLTGTAAYLARYLAGKLGSKTRAIEFSTLQRSASHCASLVDINEAFQAGSAAVKAAGESDTGKMVILSRLSDDPYLCKTDLRDVHRIANGEKVVPREWINEDGTYVTEEFVRYVRPLIQGEVHPIFVDGIPRHLFLHI